MILCQDCKHLRGRTCRNPNTADTSMIDGELKYYSAEVLRSISVCGASAKWFELKAPSKSVVEPF
jgi:hypothetical protein